MRTGGAPTLASRPGMRMTTRARSDSEGPWRRGREGVIGPTVTKTAAAAGDNVADFDDGGDPDGRH